MEAYTDENGINRVRMTDDSNHLWINTGNGETIFVYCSRHGVEMTLWAKEGVPYTKRTHHKTIINLHPKKSY